MGLDTVAVGASAAVSVKPVVVRLDDDGRFDFTGKIPHEAGAEPIRQSAPDVGQTLCGRQRAKVVAEKQQPWDGPVARGWLQADADRGGAAC